MGLGQWNEEVLWHAAQEEHRYEDNADAQGRYKRRYCDLLSAIENSLTKIFAQSELTLDIFDHDRPVLGSHPERHGP